MTLIHALIFTVYPRKFISLQLRLMVHRAFQVQLVINRFGRVQGAVSIRKTVLPGMAIPMLKIRRPNGRLIFNMEIAIRR